MSERDAKFVAQSVRKPKACIMASVFVFCTDIAQTDDEFYHDCPIDDEINKKPIDDPLAFVEIDDLFSVCALFACALFTVSRNGRCLYTNHDTVGGIAVKLNDGNAIGKFDVRET